MIDKNELRARLYLGHWWTDREDEREALIDEFSTVATEAVIEAASDLAALRARAERAEAERDALAKWIVTFGGPHRDHACARCVPHGQALIDGFVCGVHVAQDVHAASGGK